MNHLPLRTILLVALVASLILSGCTTAQSAPTQPPEPTATEQPTATSAPTDTPPPTATPIPTETPAPTATATPTPSPTPVPLTEWSAELRIEYLGYSEETGPQFTEQSLCVRDETGTEHQITLGSCEAQSASRSCPGLCSPPRGGTVPLAVDGECMTFQVGPAFDPVTFDLGGGASVTLSTLSSSDVSVIQAQVVGAPCE